MRVLLVKKMLLEILGGEYTYRPTPGPDPCGRVVWICGDQEYPSRDSYNSSSCAQNSNNRIDIEEEAQQKNYNS